MAISSGFIAVPSSLIFVEAGNGELTAVVSSRRRRSLLWGASGEAAPRTGSEPVASEFAPLVLIASCIVRREHPRALRRAASGGSVLFLRQLLELTFRHPRRADSKLFNAHLLKRPARRLEAVRPAGHAADLGADAATAPPPADCRRSHPLKIIADLPARRTCRKCIHSHVMVR
jgi:hypothetical protein